MNANSFYLARWNDPEGKEQVLVALFSTLEHLFECGALPEDARVVEAAHPENLRMDMVFYTGKVSRLQDLVEEFRNSVKTWGLFDHENSLKAQVPSADAEEAQKKLLETIHSRTLPPMWRVLELASAS